MKLKRLGMVEGWQDVIRTRTRFALRGTDKVQRIGQ